MSNYFKWSAGKREPIEPTVFDQVNDLARSLLLRNTKLRRHCDYAHLHFDDGTPNLVFANQKDNPKSRIPNVIGSTQIVGNEVDDTELIIWRVGERASVEWDHKGELHQISAYVDTATSDPVIPGVNWECAYVLTDEGRIFEHHSRGTVNSIIGNVMLESDNTRAKMLARTLSIADMHL